MKAKHGCIILGVLIISGTFNILGCGKNETTSITSGGNAGSCTVADSVSGFTTCFDYTGSGYTAATAQTTCNGTTSGSATGTYSSSACPTTGRIGSCKIEAGTVIEQYIRYMSGFIAETAQAHCSSASGTYTAN